MFAALLTSRVPPPPTVETHFTSNPPLLAFLTQRAPAPSDLFDKLLPRPSNCQAFPIANLLAKLLQSFSRPHLQPCSRDHNSPQRPTRYICQSTTRPARGGCCQAHDRRPSAGRCLGCVGRLNPNSHGSVVLGAQLSASLALIIALLSGYICMQLLTELCS